MAIASAGGIVYASHINSLEDLAAKHILVRLVQTAAQNMTDNVATTISFPSEVIDTHPGTGGAHDNALNNSRITPTVAGYYRLTGTLMIASRTDFSTIYAVIAKNGGQQAPAARLVPSTGAGVRSVTTTCIVTANGTTDYFELQGLQDNVANVAVATNVAGVNSSVLECEFLRPL